MRKSFRSCVVVVGHVIAPVCIKVAFKKKFIKLKKKKKIHSDKLLNREKKANSR